MRPGWVMVPLALGCVAVYAASAMLHARSQCPFSPDSLWYADVARFLARGEGFRCNITLASDPVPLPRTFYGWPPLYPGLAALLMRAGLSPLGALRAVSLASFISLPIPLLFLGRKIWGTIPATVATVLVILWPTTGSLSSPSLSEPLFLLLLATCLAVLVRDAHTLQRPVGAGILLGVAGLTRLVGGLFVPPLAWAVWRKRSWRHALWASAAVVLTAGPWVARNSLATGAPSGVEEPAQGERWSAVVASCVQRLLWEMGGGSPVGMLLSRHWEASCLLLLVGGALVGVFRTWADRTLLLWSGWYLLGIAWLRTKGPFDSPSGGRTLVPTLFLASYLMGGVLTRWVLARRGWWRFVWGVVGAAALVGLAAIRVGSATALPTPHCPLTECGTPGLRLLDSLASPGQVVLSNVAFKTAFCQDRPSVQLPVPPYSALQLSPGLLGALAREYRTRYVYVECPGRTGGIRDPLTAALCTGREVPGLTALLVGRDHALYRVVMAEDLTSPPPDEPHVQGLGHTGSPRDHAH